MGAKVNMLLISCITLWQFSVNSANKGECPDALKDICAQLHDTCAPKTKLDEGARAAARQGNIQDVGNLAEYLACTYRMNPGLIKDEEFDIEAFLNVYPSSELRAEYEEFSRKCGFIKSGKGLLHDLLEMTKCHFAEAPEKAYIV